MHVFPLPPSPLSLGIAPRLGTNAAAGPQTQSPSKEDLCRGHKGGRGKGEERWRRRRRWHSGVPGESRVRGSSAAAALIPPSGKACFYI